MACIVNHYCPECRSIQPMEVTTRHCFGCISKSVAKKKRKEKMDPILARTRRKQPNRIIK